MIFNLIIGNPPYQESDGRTDVTHSAVPLYNLFIERAVVDSDRFICMIIPAKWYTSGRGLGDFRRMMLSSGRISALCDYAENSECFDSVKISGGVMWFVWDKIHTGDTRVINVVGAAISEKVRPLVEPQFSRDGDLLFIRRNAHVDLYKKIADMTEFYNFGYLNSVSSTNVFQLRQTRNYVDEPLPGYVPYYTLINLRRKKKYIDPAIIKWSDSFGTLRGKWKVMAAKAGAGKDNIPTRIGSSPFIIEPDAVASETYLCLATFDKLEDALAFRDYSRTKFFRFMMLACKNSQHSPRATYRYVPNLMLRSDAEIYQLYQLTEQEIAIIESSIKAYEDD